MSTPLSSDPDLWVDDMRDLGCPDCDACTDGDGEPLIRINPPANLAQCKACGWEAPLSAVMVAIHLPTMYDDEGDES